VRQQLELWNKAEKSLTMLDIWEGLDQQDRKTVLEVLARLISKAVHTKANDNTQEKKNEQ
jgi:hypothetical protein